MANEEKEIHMELKGCCAKKRSCHNPQKETEHPGNSACNPFMPCCANFYDEIAPVGMKHFKPVVVSVIQGFKEIYYSRNYIETKWQPPEA